MASQANQILFKILKRSQETGASSTSRSEMGDHKTTIHLPPSHWIFLRKEYPYWGEPPSQKSPNKLIFVDFCGNYLYFKTEKYSNVLRFPRLAPPLHR